MIYLQKNFTESSKYLYFFQRNTSQLVILVLKDASTQTQIMEINIFLRKQPLLYKNLGEKQIICVYAGIYAQNYLKKEQRMTEEYSEFQNHYEDEEQTLKGINPTCPRSPDDQSSYAYGAKWAQNITDISFQLEASNQNTEIIKKAWGNIVDHSLQEQEDENEKNKENVSEYGQKFAFKNQKDLTEIIIKSTLLNNKEKKLMIKNLPTGNYLATTITELSQHFKEESFQELFFLIFHIWKEFQEFKEEKQAHTIDVSIFPRVKNFDAYDDFGHDHDLHLFQLDEKQNRFLSNLDMTELIKRADKISEELAYQLYFRQELKLPKIKVYSFKDTKETCQISEFKKLFSQICRAVFLSAVNCLNYEETISELNPFKRPLAQFSSFGDLLSGSISDSEDEPESAPRKIRKYY